VTRIESATSVRRLPTELFASLVSTLFAWTAFVKGFFKRKMMRKLIWLKLFVLYAKMSLLLQRRFSRLSWIMPMIKVIRITKSVPRLLKRKVCPKSRVPNWRNSK
jgi:hypothetical protein